MAEETHVAVAAGRSQILKRPRLTRLLDETESRIILLVAPAGYGKTTLAREWLEHRPHAWYRGTPASADVAALAMGLAEATRTVLSGAGRRMTERLRISEIPDADAEVFADLLSDDLSDWPTDAWIAVDDHHFLGESRDADHFLEAFVDRAPARFLLASRRRPAWVTARSLLYGEVFELGRAALSMSQDEAQQLLAAHRSEELPGLLALADGWPAILGLAAAAGNLELPDETVPSTLYDFFAEELFHPLPQDLQDHLAKLALPPVVTDELGSLLFGDAAPVVLAEATRLGILTHSPPVYELHPLLRDFLTRRLSDSEEGSRRATVGAIGRFLIAKQRWDEAFTMIERFGAADLVDPLVEEAMHSLLEDGRLSTLRRWLHFARQADVVSPILDLAEAEVAFREGAHSQAQAIALEAARNFGDGHRLLSRALALAGESAYQLDRSGASLNLHERAYKHALSEADRRRATWGQFLAAIQLESEGARDLMKKVEQAHGHSVDGTLRLATARLLLSATSERTEETVDSVRPVLFFVDRCRDAKIRTSFLYLFGSALAATANYAEALEMVERAKRDAHEYRLAFTMPFSLLVETNARVGLRDFEDAASLLQQSASLVARTHDVFLDMSTRTARCKMLIAHGGFDDAVDVTRVGWTHIPGPVVYGELLGVRALALACGNHGREALEAAARAESLTRGVEARTLAACARAIITFRERTTERAVAQAAFAVCEQTENFDSLVVALRGSPALLEFGAQSERYKPLLMEVLARSRDSRLAGTVGLRLVAHAKGAAHDLSPREHEVFTLLLQGRTNKEIAAALYVTEATVKVHVRHILQKLGVRSRMQAVLKGAVTEAKQLTPERKSHHTRGPR